MFIKIRHFYYNQLQEIIENHKKKSFKFKHSLELLLLLFWAVRLMLCMVIYSLFNQSRYLYFDSYCTFLKLFNPKLFLQYSFFSLMLAFLGILGKRIFFFSSKNTVTLQGPYDVVIRNLKQMKQCEHSFEEQNRILGIIAMEKLIRLEKNKKLFQGIIPNKLLHYFSFLLAKFDFWIHLRYIDKNRLKTFQLSLHKQTTIKCRFKIAILIFFIDFGIYYFHIAIGKSMNFNKFHLF